MQGRVIGMAAVLALGLAGCGGGGIGGIFHRKPEPVAAAAPEPVLPDPGVVDVSPLPKPAAQTAEALDTTSKAERAAAAAPQAGGAKLGTTIASLGDPTEAGFWLRTPLVKAPAKGRLETRGGASVAVDLIPLEGSPGAGSQISLSAMRMLGLSLTDLPELSVYGL